MDWDGKGYLCEALPFPYIMLSLCAWRMGPRCCGTTFLPLLPPSLSFSEFKEEARSVHVEALLEAQRESLRDKEPEIIQNEAPMTSGVMQGMFSCACEPCEPASGDRVLVSAPVPSALPSSQVTRRQAVQPAPQPAWQLRYLVTVVTGSPWLIRGDN